MVAVRRPDKTNPPHRTKLNVRISLTKAQPEQANQTTQNLQKNKKIRKIKKNRKLEKRTHTQKHAQVPHKNKLNGRYREQNGSSRVNYCLADATRNTVALVEYLLQQT